MLFCLLLALLLLSAVGYALTVFLSPYLRLSGKSALLRAVRSLASLLASASHVHVLTHVSSSTRCSTCSAWYAGCFPSHSLRQRAARWSALLYCAELGRCGSESCSNRPGLDASPRHPPRGQLCASCIVVHVTSEKQADQAEASLRRCLKLSSWLPQLERSHPRALAWKLSPLRLAVCRVVSGHLSMQTRTY